MSKSKQNALTKFYSGMFGQDFVLRNHNGTSTLAKPPRPSGMPPSDNQEEVRTNFSLAANYAKGCSRNPELSAYYSSQPEKGTSVYRLAMMDYLRAPVVKRIKTESYKGLPDDKIVIVAMDDFEVVKVNVRITGIDGTLIEEGTCVRDSINTVWIYQVTVEVPDLNGVVIAATAYDTPGNIGENSVML